MNSKILKELCARCALALNDTENERMVADLTLILDYVDQIHAVTTDGFEPLIHPLNIGNVRELDEPETTRHQDLIQMKSIETVEDFYVVPIVIKP